MRFSQKKLHLLVFFIQPSTHYRAVDREIEAPPAPCGEQGNPKQIILGSREVPCTAAL